MKRLHSAWPAVAGLFVSAPAFAGSIAVFEFPESSPMENVDSVVVIRDDRFTFEISREDRGGVELAFDGGMAPEVTTFWVGTHETGIQPGSYTDAGAPQLIYDAVFPAVGGGVGLAYFSACGNRATLTVHEAEYGGDDVLDALAVDFEMPCNAAGEPARGSVRYNSTVPLSGLSHDVIIDTALIGKPGEELVLEAVFANGFTPTAGSGAWTQVAGPAVAEADRVTSGAANEVLTFTVPAVDHGGEVILFEYVASDADARAARAIAAAKVVHTADPRNSISLVSTAGEKMLDGRSVQLTEPWLGMTMYAPSAAAVSGSFNVPEAWNIEMDAGSAGTLTTGDYEYIAGTSDTYFLAGVVFAGCASADSTFSVNSITRDEWGFLETLDADFQQSCDGTPETLSGRLVYAGEGTSAYLAKSGGGASLAKARGPVDASSLPARYRNKEALR